MDNLKVKFNTNYFCSIHVNPNLKFSNLYKNTLLERCFDLVLLISDSASGDNVLPINRSEVSP